MNATRKFAKKSGNIVKYAYDTGTQSLASTAGQGILILILILYSAIFVKNMPVGFLKFFENIIVKIIFLVIIAFVGIFSPAVALFLAIALICTLQQSQKTRLVTDIRSIQPSQVDLAKLKLMAMRQNLIESMDNQGAGQQYLDPNMMAGSNNKVEQRPPRNYIKAVTNYFTKPRKEVIPEPTAEYVPIKKQQLKAEGNTAEKEYEDVPLGFNNDDSCLACSGGPDAKPAKALNSQCGYVQTWKDQFSAQGLGSDVVGYQKPYGYPV